jgi:uncharacterized membrane protein
MKKILCLSMLTVVVPIVRADYGCFRGYGMMGGYGAFGVLWLVVAAFVFSLIFWGTKHLFNQKVKK